jgi:hypothetical protein
MTKTDWNAAQGHEETPNCVSPTAIFEQSDGWKVHFLGVENGNGFDKSNVVPASMNLLVYLVANPYKSPGASLNIPLSLRVRCRYCGNPHVTRSIKL